MAAVGTTAFAKVVVMGLGGVLGILTTRLIVGHFGTDVYAQYGLLTNFSTLLPFADLGIAAVVINTIAGSSDVRNDEAVRRTIVTAMRILLTSGVVIGVVAVTVTALGLWPALLGEGLVPGSGELAAMWCLIAFGVALPLTIGQRILVGLQRTGWQVLSQSVVAPFMLISVFTLVSLSAPAGSFLAVLSYIGNGLVSVVCLVISARLISPQLRIAVRELPKVRSVPGVRVMNTAGPMLMQTLAMPLALQTDRLLLSHLAGSDELAQYNLGSQLFGLVLTTIATAGVALWPIYAKARSNAMIEAPWRPTAYFFIGGLGLSGLLALLSPWVVDFVGNGRIELDWWLLGGFVAFAAMQAGKYPVGMYMTDSRGLAFQVPPILVMIPMNFLLSWWLIGLVGAGGTIIASAISVGVCQVVPNIWYVRRDLRRRRAEAARQQERPAEPVGTPEA